MKWGVSFVPCVRYIFQVLRIGHELDFFDVFFLF